jgi:coronin-1B/1C/6
MNTSKFRHVFGTPHKRELCYDNLKISPNAWDSNIVKVNSVS